MSGDSGALPTQSLCYHAASFRPLFYLHLFFTYTQSYNAVTPSTPCPTCFWQLDASQVYSATWHDAAERRSGSCTFRGSAIYLYGVDVPGGANISFTMNTPAMQTYHHYDGDSTGAVYHALLFQAGDLDPDTEHTLTWLLEPAADGGSVGILDYAIVTQADLTDSNPPAPSPSATNSKRPVTLIVGAVVAAIGGCAVMITVVFVLWRRKRSRDAHVKELHLDTGAEMESAALLTIHPFHVWPAAPRNLRPGKQDGEDVQSSILSQDSGESTLEARIRSLETQVAGQLQAPPPY
ncbi:hypothetical protein FB451DRAFT_1300699 [Mycena latifolia]|nr:hypothetical protein FB451DRAFT_1300699 [Mycena latifolia]